MRYKATHTNRKIFIRLTISFDVTELIFFKFKFTPNASLYASSTVLSDKSNSCFAIRVSVLYNSTISLYNWALYMSELLLYSSNRYYKF